MRLKVPLFRWLRHWHARIGVFAALFFFFLIVSGIALNHTSALKLAEHELKQTWLMRWYGLRADVPTHGFQLGSEYLTWDAQRWVLGARVIAKEQGKPIGAVRSAQVVYVASADALYLYAPTGQLIEKIDVVALPGKPLQRLGVTGERVVLGTGNGNFSSADGLEWSAFRDEPAWQDEQPVPDAERNALSEIYAPGIDSQRVLLDLHSGRIFGRYGPVVIDIVALALLALVLSGVWMYVRAARLQRHREH